MATFKVQKTDLKLNRKRYKENSTDDFDEKNKDVKKLVEAGILVPVQNTAPAPKKLSDNTVSELLDIAKAEEIEIPSGITKKNDIIAEIEEARKKKNS